MIVTVENSPVERRILPSQMLIGEVGYIYDHNNSKYNGDIVMLAGRILVSLTNPQNIWSNIDELTFKIVIFPPNTIVKLHI